MTRSVSLLLAAALFAGCTTTHLGGAYRTDVRPLCAKARAICRKDADCGFWRLAPAPEA